MPKISHLSASLLFAACVSIAAIGQTPAPTPTPSSLNSDEGQVIKVESRLVVVPVSVTDANDQPVTGLTVNDFRVLEEGKAQKIETLGTADVVPLEIVLLFDISASTQSMFKFQKETAAQFLGDVMRPIDHAAIFTLGETPILVQPRDTAEKSIAAINNLTLPSKQLTAFYDTVGTAADYLRQNAPEATRRVIVTISDGEDTNSARVISAIQAGYKQVGDKINTIDSKTLYELTVKNRDRAVLSERVRVAKAIQDADTVFYSINPSGSSISLNKISMVGQENMQLLANETGGEAFLPTFKPVDTTDALQNTSDDHQNRILLQKIFRQLAAELRAQYLIEYYPETEYPNGRFVKLDVGLQNAAGRKVRARQGYYVKH